MRRRHTPFSKEGLRAIFCHALSMNSERRTLAASTPSQKNDKSVGCCLRNLGCWRYSCFPSESEKPCSFHRPLLREIVTMTCERCGAEAPTRRVNFYRNIGLLVFRLTESTECRLCKPCIHQVFWKYMLINVTLGWWGAISIILTPLIILSNTVQYLFCLGMATAPQNAVAEGSSGTTLEATSHDAARSTSHSSGEIIECPFCRTRVSVSERGTCPSCQASL